MIRGCQGLGGGGNGELRINVYKVSMRQDASVPEMCCRTLSTVNSTLFTLRNPLSVMIAPLLLLLFDL